MKATVAWKSGLAFRGVGASGIPIPIDSRPTSGEESHGLRPMELILMGLVACMGMDVMSILEKKRQKVTACHVNVDAPRSVEYPHVFTSALITFVLTGRSLEEKALLRSIELSATKYCSAYAMLEKAFPIGISYEIYEQGSGDDDKGIVYEGTWQKTVP